MQKLKYRATPALLGVIGVIAAMGGSFGFK